jgi:hypothetical protein
VGSYLGDNLNPDIHSQLDNDTILGENYNKKETTKISIIIHFHIKTATKRRGKEICKNQLQTSLMNRWMTLVMESGHQPDSIRNSGSICLVAAMFRK